MEHMEIVLTKNELMKIWTNESLCQIYTAFWENLNCISSESDGPVSWHTSNIMLTYIIVNYVEFRN